MSETTTQARILDPPAILERIATRWGRLGRLLFRDLHVHRLSLPGVKRAFLARYRISARQFNSLRIDLEGKVRAWEEGRKERMAQIQEAIRRLEKRIRRREGLKAKLTRKIASRRPSRRAPSLQAFQDRRRKVAFQVHQLRRRLRDLRFRIQSLERAGEGVPSICFGSRRLFRRQFHLKANGYADHAAWLRDWRKARSGQFTQVGSRDETRGNGECQWDPGQATLRLRVPDAHARGRQKHLEIPVDFARNEDLLASLEAGRAISYRFLRRSRSEGRGGQDAWYVHATTLREPALRTTRRELGIVGADLNADHVAVAELDRFGNLVGLRRIPLEVQGLTTDQAVARTGEAVAELVGLAKAAGKPLAIEALDFRRKKAALRELGKRQAHRLSSFAFSRFQDMAASRCEREGVELARVDPRLTSVIGLAKFGGYGIGTHVAAAMAIGRRALGMGEALKARTASPRLEGDLLDRLREIVKGRKAGEHVLTCWQRLTPWLKSCLRKGGPLRSAQDGGVRASGRHPCGRGSPSARDGPSGQAPRCLDASRSRRSGGDLGATPRGDEEHLQ